MSEQADDRHAMQRHWRVMRPTAVGLTLAWALVTFVPPFLPQHPAFEVAGAGIAVWIAAQLGPLVYLLLVWWYERRASRLDPQGSTRDGA